METLPPIFVLGAAEVGKTALIMKVISGTFSKCYEPTIEDSYMHGLLLGSKFVKLTISDTGGDLQYQSLRSQWCRAGSAFIIVFSAASLESFQWVGHFAQMIEMHHPDGCPLALVATKTDLMAKVSVEEAQACAGSLNAEYFRFSSTGTKDEAQQPFAYVARELLARKNAETFPVAKGGDTNDLATRWWGRLKVIAQLSSAFGTCFGPR